MGTNANAKDTFGGRHPQTKSGQISNWQCNSNSVSGGGKLHCHILDGTHSGADDRIKTGCTRAQTVSKNNGLPAAGVNASSALFKAWHLGHLEVVQQSAAAFSLGPWCLAQQAGTATSTIAACEQARTHSTRIHPAPAKEASQKAAIRSGRKRRRMADFIMPESPGGWLFFYEKPQGWRVIPQLEREP